MPVLNAPDNQKRVETTQAWLAPPPPLSWSDRFFDALENPRNRAAAVLVSLAVLLGMTLAVLGARNEETIAASPSQPILTEDVGDDGPAPFGAVDLDADPADEANAAPEEDATDDAADDAANDAANDKASDDDDDPTDDDDADLEQDPVDPPPAEDDETPTEPTSPSTTEATTTEAPTTEATTPPTDPTTTETPTTAAPVTEAPTTAAPVTEAPTTAAPTTGAPPAPSGGSVQEQVLSLTNAERATAGCPALSLNGSLNAASTAHSQDMAANGYFSHTGLNGSQPWDRAKAAGYPQSGMAENIAQGQTSPQAVVSAWMNSSGHRANILNCSYVHMGLGHVPNGNYWTQMFGAG